MSRLWEASDVVQKTTLPKKNFIQLTTTANIFFWSAKIQNLRFYSGKQQTVMNRIWKCMPLYIIWLQPIHNNRTLRLNVFSITPSTQHRLLKITKYWMQIFYVDQLSMITWTWNNLKSCKKIRPTTHAHLMQQFEANSGYKLFKSNYILSRCLRLRLRWTIVWIERYLLWHSFMK